MNRFTNSIVFFCVLMFLPTLVSVKGQEYPLAPRDVGTIMSELGEYYKRVYTAEIECSVKETQASLSSPNKSGTTKLDDLLVLKLNFERKEVLKRTISTKVPSSGRSREVLLTPTDDLRLKNDTSGEIVVIGDSRAHSDKAGIPPVFSICDQVLPFGFFSNGRKTFHLLEWLENNRAKVSRSTNEECVIESSGPDGNLEIVLTNYDNSFFVTSLTYSISADQRTRSLYDKIKYQVVNHKVIDNFWLPTQFVVDAIGHGEGGFRYEPETDKVVPLPPHPYTTEVQFVFTDVKINPFPKNQEITFDTPLPDHTKVHLLSQKQIEYVWVNGKIVPLTNEIALANARGHGFVPGKNAPRFWMMALGIAMILYAIGLKIYRYLKERRAK